MATTAFTKAPCSPPPKVKKAPACPDCGALECLCRPRFFAGQLLSEQDLTRLDQYIKKKNQLHNRNLHGWGTVNGLKVLCDPCGQIKVTKGYAISPCGDDIVVCEDTPVDICSLIRKCKENSRDSVDCKPFGAPDNANCEELEEEWVLAIRYSEFPNRGMTALLGGGCACGKPDGTCQCQGNGNCGCGQSGNCDCGASGSANTSKSKPRSAPAECEPTIVCEGFQFDVFRKQEPDDIDGSPDDDLEFGGELGEAFKCCVNDLFGVIPATPGEAKPEIISQNPAAWHQWCCRTRDAMITYFSRHPGTNCELIEALYSLVCPNPNTQFFPQQMTAVANQLGMIMMEAMFNCLCLALLPPAPEGTGDPRVPLATVKVRGKDCKIISVCNWTVCRKMVTTWPTMCYWWSIVPIGKIIAEALDELCCNNLVFGKGDTFSFDSLSDSGTPAVNEATGDGIEDIGSIQKMMASHRLNPQFNLDREVASVSRFFTASMARGKQPLDPAALLNSISRFNLSSEQPNLAKIESRNLPQFLMLNSLVRPLALSGLTEAKKGNFLMAALFDNLGASGLDEFEESADAGDLQSRVADLESKLDQQRKVLESLQPADSGGLAAKKTVTRKVAGRKTGKKATRKAVTKKSSGKK